MSGDDVTRVENGSGGCHDDPDAAEHPRALVPELCKQFYTLGWVTGRSTLSLSDCVNVVC